MFLEFIINLLFLVFLFFHLFLLLVLFHDLHLQLLPNFLIFRFITLVYSLWISNFGIESKLLIDVNRILIWSLLNQNQLLGIWNRWVDSSFLNLLIFQSYIFDLLVVCFYFRYQLICFDLCVFQVLVYLIWKLYFFAQTLVFYFCSLIDLYNTLLRTVILISFYFVGLISYLSMCISISNHCVSARDLFDLSFCIFYV